MRYQSIVLILLTCLGLWGCSGQPKPSQKSKSATQKQPKLPDFSSVNTSNVYAYACGDSLQFSAQVTKDSTWLFLPDTTLKTLPVKAGSGAKYEGARYIYWSKGNQAILQGPTGPFLTCKAVPKEKSWAAAKIRGVDFRALGQEPGWILEITKGKQLTYIGNYGKDTLATSVPKPKENGERTIYQANTDSHKLEITIAEKPCTDSMSGFQFPKSVGITVDGKKYHGCGRSLN